MVSDRAMNKEAIIFDAYRGFKTQPDSILNVII
jgi:hypothetical protein